MITLASLSVWLRKNRRQRVKHFRILLQKRRLNAAFLLRNRINADLISVNDQRERRGIAVGAPCEVEGERKDEDVAGKPRRVLKIPAGVAAR